MALEQIIVNCTHCHKPHSLNVDTYLKPNQIETCGECNSDFLVWYDPSDQVWVTSAGYELKHEKGEKPNYFELFLKGSDNDWT